MSRVPYLIYLPLIAMPVDVVVHTLQFFMGEQMVRGGRGCACVDTCEALLHVTPFFTLPAFFLVPYPFPPPALLRGRHLLPLLHGLSLVRSLRSLLRQLRPLRPLPLARLLPLPRSRSADQRPRVPSCAVRQANRGGKSRALRHLCRDVLRRRHDSLLRALRESAAKRRRCAGLLARLLRHRLLSCSDCWETPDGDGMRWERRERDADEEEVGDARSKFVPLRTLAATAAPHLRPSSVLGPWSWEMFSSCCRVAGGGFLVWVWVLVG